MGYHIDQSWFPLCKLTLFPVTFLSLIIVEMNSSIICSTTFPGTEVKLMSLQMLLQHRSIIFFSSSPWEPPFMPMTFQRVLSVALAHSQSIHGCIPSYPMALPKSSQFKYSPSLIQLCWGNSSILQTFLLLLGTSSSWKQVLPEKAETGVALSPPVSSVSSVSRSLLHWAHFP